MDSEDPFAIMYYEYKSTHLWYLHYHWFFMIRRLWYAWVIVFLKSDSLLQNCGWVLCMFTIFSYQAIFRPYRTQIYNVIMLINETWLVVITVMFYAYVKPNPDTTQSESIGWAIIIIIISDVILNMVVLWYLKIRGWIKMLNKLKRSTQSRKRLRRVHNESVDKLSEDIERSRRQEADYTERD